MILQLTFTLNNTLNNTFTFSFHRELVFPEMELNAASDECQAAVAKRREAIRVYLRHPIK